MSHIKNYPLNCTSDSISHPYVFVSKVSKLLTVTGTTTMWGSAVSTPLSCIRDDHNSKIFQFFVDLLWFFGTWYVALLLMVLLILAQLLTQKSSALQKSKAKLLKYEIQRNQVGMQEIHVTRQFIEGSGR